MNNKFINAQHFKKVKIDFREQAERRTDFTTFTRQGFLNIPDNELIATIERIMNKFFPTRDDYARLLYMLVVIPEVIARVQYVCNTVWGSGEDLGIQMIARALTGAIKLEIFPCYVTRSGYKEKQIYRFPHILSAGRLASEGLPWEDLITLGYNGDPTFVSADKLIAYNEYANKAKNVFLATTLSLDDCEDPDEYYASMLPGFDDSEEESSDCDEARTLGETCFMEEVGERLNVQFSDDVIDPTYHWREDSCLTQVVPSQLRENVYMVSVRKSVQFIMEQFNKQKLGEQYVAFEGFYTQSVALSVELCPTSLLQQVYHLFGSWFASRFVRLERKCALAYRIYSVIWRYDVLAPKTRKIMVDFECENKLPPVLLRTKGLWDVLEWRDWWKEFQISPMQINSVGFSYTSVCGYADMSREDSRYIGYYAGTYGVLEGADILLNKLSAYVPLLFYDDETGGAPPKHAAKVLDRYGRVGDARGRDILRVTSDQGGGHVRVRIGDDWERLYIYLRCLHHLSRSNHDKE